MSVYRDCILLPRLYTFYRAVDGLLKNDCLPGLQFVAEIILSSRPAGRLLTRYDHCLPVSSTVGPLHLRLIAGRELHVDGRFLVVVRHLTANGQHVQVVVPWRCHHAHNLYERHNVRSVSSRRRREIERNCCHDPFSP